MPKHLRQQRRPVLAQRQMAHEQAEVTALRHVSQHELRGVDASAASANT